MKDSSNTNRESRANIIGAVKTPLGFFALSLLIFEVALIAVTSSFPDPARVNLFWGNLIIIFLNHFNW